MNISLRQLQLLELEIVKEIKRVCNKYNIKYYLEGGTLLGAVRHQGFIPWDDDMDVGMELDEYKKFEQVAEKELDKRFEVVNWDTDCRYPHPYMKVCLRKSCAVEKAAILIKPEPRIWVDVFPYIRIDNKSMMKINILRGKIIRGAMLCACGYLNEKKSVVFIVEKMISNILGRERIKKIYKNYINRIQSDSGELLSPLDDIITGEYVFDADCLDESTELVFEKEYFRCSGRYHEILTNYYGDYMKIPPKEEQNKGHSIVKCTIDYPFEYYFLK